MVFIFFSFFLSREKDYQKYINHMHGHRDAELPLLTVVQIFSPPHPFNITLPSFLLAFIHDILTSLPSMLLKKNNNKWKNSQLHRLKFGILSFFLIIWRWSGAWNAVKNFHRAVDLIAVENQWGKDVGKIPGVTTYSQTQVWVRF